MRNTPLLQKAQANMQPGVISADGFLGDDTRNLADIIEADEETLRSLGLDVETLCDRLEFLMDEGRKGLGDWITVQGRWLVRTDEARGHLTSPFEDGMFRKVNIEVELLENGSQTGKKILFSDLSLHMIKQFHFFEGKGSPFRLEPALAKEVLGL